MIIYLYIIILLFPLFHCVEFLTFDLKPSVYGTFSIELCVGSFGFCDHFTLTFSDYKLKIYENSIFNPTTNSEGYLNIDISRTGIYSNLSFPKSKSSVVEVESNFISIENPLAKCTIGLSEDSLFVYHIYDLLNSKLFYIDTKNKYLLFGDFPEVYYKRYINKLKSYKHCALIQKNLPLYSCYVDSIYFNNIIYPIETSVTFDIGVNAIYVKNKDLLDLIARTTFATFIEGNICKYKYKDKLYYIECNETFNYMKEEKLGDVNIIFNMYNIRVLKKDLFINLNGKLLYMIMYNEDNNNNGWVFGSVLFKSNIVIIDKQHNQIGFIPYTK